MLIDDRRYFALVKALTDLHVGSDRYVVLGRNWIETDVQHVLCLAHVFPASSADCDPNHPAVVLHGGEPSSELVAEVDQALASLGSLH
ncbi:hypothetical protein ACVWXM_008035 [Bradyrhizobium sp. GM7.3]